MDSTVLEWLRNQHTTVTFRTSLDRLYLLDELVKSGEFRSRTQAILKAIDSMLEEYFPYRAEEEVSA